MWRRGLLILLMWIAVCHTAGAERVDVSGLRVDPTPAKNVKDLIRRCDLIVVGWTDSAHQSFRTREHVPGGRIVNYVQVLQIKTALKGTAPRLVKLLSTGVEPLPDPSSSLNAKFPGPLAEGEYLLFLQKVKGSHLHSIVGLWQGVYPMYGDKTITLQHAGFPELNNLTIAQLREKMKQLAP
jgi:hypothetical protein